MIAAGAVIRTRYLGPTNYRGARIVAETTDHNPHTGRPDRATVPYPYELGPGAAAHAVAARALVDRLGWHGPYVAGYTRDGYTFTRLAEPVTL